MASRNTVGILHPVSWLHHPVKNRKFNKPNFAAAKLESLQSEKKGRKIY